MFERLSTPRPAHKVTLKSNWLVQQQQLLICNEVVTSTSKVVAVWESQSGPRDGTRDVRGYATGNGDSSGKLVQDSEPKVICEQKPDVDIDLRVQGVSQDATLEDEATMREINQQVTKIKAGSNKISIRNDLANDGMIFSEESSRAIYEMGNVELIELKHISETTMSSCLKHVFEDMSSIRSIENSILSYCTNHFERKEMWSQSLTTRPS